MTCDILILDDGPVSQASLPVFVQLLPEVKEVTVFKTPQALTKHLTNSDTIARSILLLDIELTGCHPSNGVQLCGDLKQLFPTLRILMVSNHSELKFGYASLAAGADGYVEKNDTDRGVSVLLEAIATVAKHNRHFRKTTISPATLLNSTDLFILDSVGRGFATEEIASLLDLSPSSIRRHWHSIWKEKLHLASSGDGRRFAAAYAHDAAFTLPTE